jgi:hypothetical protein
MFSNLTLTVRCSLAVKAKVNFTLGKIMKTQMENIGAALFYFNLSARLCVWSMPHPGPFTWKQDPVPIV